MPLKSLRQTVTFKASPHAVYELLMDSKKHTAFSGDRASISRKVGGKFKAYGDYIEGQNLVLIEDKMIVQTWRASDWPKDHYSRVSFVFTKVKGGTRLSFNQSGIPASDASNIKQGWIDFYWNPMKSFLSSRD